MASQRQLLSHGFGPFFCPDSRVLILGSFPSVKSREQQFFYGHARNRFWQVLAALCDEPAPETLEEKRRFLRIHRIALYDVIEQCSIVGSSDSSIRDVVPADLAPILSASQIGARIFTNGKKAAALYDKYLFPKLGVRAIPLPSTSPANAACSADRLTALWREALAPCLNEGRTDP